MGIEHMEALGGFATDNEEFVYPKEYFLQRLREEIYRCNRKNQCFCGLKFRLKAMLTMDSECKLLLGKPQRKAVKFWRHGRLLYKLFFQKNICALWGKAEIVFGVCIK